MTISGDDVAQAIYDACDDNIGAIKTERDIMTAQYGATWENEHGAVIEAVVTTLMAVKTTMYDLLNPEKQ